MRLRLNVRERVLFISRYPRKARPFYTMPDPEDEESTLGFDCLFRGLEVATGSQRIHDYNMLVESIKRIGGDPGELRVLPSRS